MIAVEFLVVHDRYCKGEIAGIPKKDLERLVDAKIVKVYKKDTKKPDTKVSNPDTKK